MPVKVAQEWFSICGGCEVTMGGNTQVAAAETYIGLVEFGVGLIPGGGGNLQLLRNLHGMYAGSKDIDGFNFVKKAFLTIGMAKVATSAEEAKEAGFLAHDAFISMNRDHLLADAKARPAGSLRRSHQTRSPIMIYIRPTKYGTTNRVMNPGTGKLVSGTLTVTVDPAPRARVRVTLWPRVL